MGLQARLIWLVVIRADHHGRIRAGGMGMLDQPDGFCSGIGPSACDHRYASCSHVYTKRDNFAVLFMAERRRFAGRAARNKRAGASRNLTLDKRREC